MFLNHEILPGSPILLHQKYCIHTAQSYSSISFLVVGEGGSCVKDTLLGTLYTLCSLVLTTCLHMHIILFSWGFKSTCTFLVCSKLRFSKMEGYVCTSSENSVSAIITWCSPSRVKLCQGIRQFLRCGSNLMYFKDEENES